MSTVRYHKAKIGEHELKPETAEQGRDFFDYMAGRRAPPVDAEPGLVYSRFNHPNLEIVEDRLAIHEKAESGLVFASGCVADVYHGGPACQVLDASQTQQKTFGQGAGMISGS